MLITFIVLPLAGRLKVIALASAVGVSAGLITLTVAIMIRWQEVHCYLLTAHGLFLYYLKLFVSFF